MCVYCDWLCVVVWFGCVCVFVLMRVLVCVSCLFLACVRFVCEVLCVVAWFICCCDLCCVCACVFKCVFCVKYIV